MPVCDILGGRVRDRVPFASYLFFRYAERRRHGEVRTPEQLVAHARELKQQYGFTHAQAERRRLPAGLRARVLSRGRRRVSRRQLPLRSERRLVDRAGDPVRPGDRGPQQRLPRRSGLRPDRACGTRARRLRMPLATNTVVVNFEQLAANVLDTRGRRDPARHDVLGRHPPVRQGRRRLRDVPARRRGALVRRARHPARDDAASRRGRPEPVVRRRRALPPSRRRHHRRRQAAVRRRRDPRARRRRAWASGSIAQKLAQYAELYRELGNYPYDQDPGAPRLGAAGPERSLGRSQRRPGAVCPTDQTGSSSENDTADARRGRARARKPRRIVTDTVVSTCTRTCSRREFGRPVAVGHRQSADLSLPRRRIDARADVGPSRLPSDDAGGAGRPDLGRALRAQHAAVGSDARRGRGHVGAWGWIQRAPTCARHASSSATPRAEEHVDIVFERARVSAPS